MDWNQFDFHDRYCFALEVVGMFHNQMEQMAAVIVVVIAMLFEVVGTANQTQSCCFSFWLVYVASLDCHETEQCNYKSMSFFIRRIWFLLLKNE